MYALSCWRHQMETFSALLAICAGIHRSPVNSPLKGQWRGALMVSFDLHLNKRLSKQSWCWWVETPSRPLWRHCNVMCKRQWSIWTWTCSTSAAPSAKVRAFPSTLQGAQKNSDVYSNVVKLSTTKKIAPLNYTRRLLMVAAVYLLQ